MPATLTWRTSETPLGDEGVGACDGHRQSIRIWAVAERAGSCWCRVLSRRRCSTKRSAAPGRALQADDEQRAKVAPRAMIAASAGSAGSGVDVLSKVDGDGGQASSQLRGVLPMPCVSNPALLSAAGQSQQPRGVWSGLRRWRPAPVLSPPRRPAASAARVQEAGPGFARNPDSGPVGSATARPGRPVAAVARSSPSESASRRIRGSWQG